MGIVTNLINSKDPKGPFSSCFCFGYMQIMGDMDLKFIFRSVVILLWHFSYYKPKYNKIPKWSYFTVILHSQKSLFFTNRSFGMFQPPKLVSEEKSNKSRCSKYLEWIAQVNTIAVENALSFRVLKTHP